VTRVTYDEFRAMVEEARSLLAAEWRVKVIFGTAPDQDQDKCNASIGVYSDYLRADLYCPPSALKRDPADVRRTAFHEILHLVLNDIDDAGKLAGRQLGSQASQLHYEVHNKELERVVDRLACVLSSSG
jgi:hypothetical protein